MISNATDAATMDVMLFGLSFVGIKQTMSPPITFNPFTAWIREIASSIEKPLYNITFIKSHFSDMKFKLKKLIS